MNRTSLLLALLLLLAQPARADELTLEHGSRPLPAGATGLIVRGLDEAGREIYRWETTRLAPTLSMAGFPSSVRTFRLEYRGAAGVVARFATTPEPGPRRRIVEPALVDASSPVTTTFAFYGCNRVALPTGPHNLPSTANVAQLRRDFAELASGKPIGAIPDLLLFCGDLVMNEEEGVEVLREQLTGWLEVAASTPLFASPVRLVVVPGNHEMVVARHHEQFINPPTGKVWEELLARFIPASNGPTPAPPNPDRVARDESRLSYSFRHGRLLFIGVNTDTYVGDLSSAGVGRVPLDWLRRQLAAGDADPEVDHIFVFGHRQIEAPGGFTGIHPEQLEAFQATLAESPKLRAYLTAHAHLWHHGVRRGAFDEIVAGNGGSRPSPNFETFGWFGYTVVRIHENGHVSVEARGNRIRTPYDTAEPAPPSHQYEHFSLVRSGVR